MFVSPYYKEVLAALRPEIGISFDDLARQVGSGGNRSTSRLEFALDDLTKIGLVKPITGAENTPRRAWLWKLGDPVALGDHASPAIPARTSPEPRLPHRGGRRTMGDPEYVYQPVSEETRANMRAAARKRTDTPEGFCRMYGVLVPIQIKALCAKIAANAIRQAEKRMREKGKQKPRGLGRVP